MIKDNDKNFYLRRKFGDEEVGETEDSGEDYRTDKRNLKNEFANAYNKTPIPKLFLTLSMAIYGVIAYSKGKEGVGANDLSLFAFFILFVVVIFIILTISAHFYRGFINKLLEFSNKKDLPFIFIIGGLLLLLCIVFKSQIINLIENYIRLFVNL